MERARYIKFENCQWDPNVEWWHWRVNKEKVLAEEKDRSTDLASWLNRPSSFTSAQFYEEKGPYRSLINKLDDIRAKFTHIWNSKPRQSTVNVKVDLEHGRVDFVQDTDIILGNETTRGISAMKEMDEVIFEAAEAVFRKDAGKVGTRKRKLTHIAGFHWYPSAWAIKIKDDGTRKIRNSVKNELERAARVKSSFKAQVLRQMGFASKKNRRGTEKPIQEKDLPDEDGIRVFSVSLMDDREPGTGEYGELEWLINRGGRPQPIPVPANIPENWSLDRQDPDTGEDNIEQGPVEEIPHPDDTADRIWGMDWADGWNEGMQGMSPEEFEVLRERKTRLLKMATATHELWGNKPRSRPIAVKSMRDGTMISVEWGKAWRRPYLGEEPEIRKELREVMERARDEAFEGMSPGVLEQEYCAWSSSDEFWNWGLRGYAQPRNISFAENQTREKVASHSINLQERRIQARLYLSRSRYHAKPGDDLEPQIAKEVQDHMEDLAAEIRRLWDAQWEDQLLRVWVTDDRTRLDVVAEIKRPTDEDAVENTNIKVKDIILAATKAILGENTMATVSMSLDTTRENVMFQWQPLPVIQQTTDPKEPAEHYKIRQWKQESKGRRFYSWKSIKEKVQQQLQGKVLTSENIQSPIIIWDERDYLGILEGKRVYLVPHGKFDLTISSLAIEDMQDHRNRYLEKVQVMVDGQTIFMDFETAPITEYPGDFKTMEGRPWNGYDRNTHALVKRVWSDKLQEILNRRVEVRLHQEANQGAREKRKKERSMYGISEQARITSGGETEESSLLPQVFVSQLIGDSWAEESWEELRRVGKRGTEKQDSDTLGDPVFYWDNQQNFGIYDGDEVSLLSQRPYGVFVPKTELDVLREPGLTRLNKVQVKVDGVTLFLDFAVKPPFGHRQNTWIGWIWSGYGPEIKKVVLRIWANKLAEVKRYQAEQVQEKLITIREQCQMLGIKPSGPMPVRVPQQVYTTLIDEDIWIEEDATQVHEETESDSDSVTPTTTPQHLSNQTPGNLRQEMEQSSLGK
ncbi:hypothetical protein C8J56DRAFT_1058120 [Mycena floridula]|nr:hypothetical protein C8J56DRAFT_1058120 [Mycena floridula]